MEAVKLPSTYGYFKYLPLKVNKKLFGSTCRLVWVYNPWDFKTTYGHRVISIPDFKPGFISLGKKYCHTWTLIWLLVSSIQARPAVGPWCLLISQTELDYIGNCQYVVTGVCLDLPGRQDRVSDDVSRSTVGPWCLLTSQTELERKLPCLHSYVHLVGPINTHTSNQIKLNTFIQEKTIYLYEQKCTLILAEFSPGERM